MFIIIVGLSGFGFAAKHNVMDMMSTLNNVLLIMFPSSMV